MVEVVVAEAGGVAQRVEDRRNAAHGVGADVSLVAQRIVYYIKIAVAVVAEPGRVPERVSDVIEQAGRWSRRTECSDGPTGR